MIAGAWANDIEPSGYAPSAGSKFFLIAENPFGSDETATVRLDGPMEEVGVDADILIYRVPEPLTFLKSQRNPHRIQVAAKARPEGAVNAISYVFDVWYKKTRLAWQRIFSSQARTQVVSAIPELKQTPPYTYRTEFRRDPQIQPLPGFELVDRFRYPIWDARPIQPDPSVAMQGSSSGFLSPRKGDVKIPLGKLTPGLYLVEAAIGGHRAVTTVFVSDVIAVAKVSREQLLVWTADRKTGRPAEQAHILFSDGVGVMEEGETDQRGLLIMRRKIPEHSYLIGQDIRGGVFVAENFYYDSEIEGDKLYAFTDRPLYQPGDRVHLKLVGRTFQDNLQSSPLAAGDITLAVLDPNGTPVTTQNFQTDSRRGGNAEFRLPAEAIPGGYTLNMRYLGAVFMGAFRVAAYAKPHFDVDINTREQEYKTGQSIHVRVQLRYPTGEPVKDAKVEFNLRSQALNLLGDQGYYNYYTGGRTHFPVKLAQESLTADNKGVVEFELPPAKDPSHYILRVASADNSAYRVTAMKEIIIESGHKLYQVTTASRISKAGEGVDFSATPLKDTGMAPGLAVTWETLRLEDQSHANGEVKDGRFRVEFGQAGAYTLQVKDANGDVVGQTEHWVSGGGAKLAAGGIRIDLDKEEYTVGETAYALINFRDPVENALLTLERDAVEGFGLLTEGNDWTKMTRINETQWRADIPIRPGYAPNRVFSVLYAKNGQYAFQNKGVKVRIPAVEIVFTADKSVYLPGEEVRIEVRAQLEGRPVATRLAVGVVDEAVYSLQPEIAPNIEEFFQHIRRNQVRTTSTLNFHAYDMALPVERDAPPPPSFSNRPLKMLERPRREIMDTAVWLPDLETDAEGKTSFMFKMPESLSRWRITGRAWTDDGAFGQSVGQIVSAKDFYLKWTGPTAFLEGEKPIITVVGYNRTVNTETATFTASGEGVDVNREVELKPGANYLELPFEAKTGASFALTTSLAVAGRTLDSLNTPIQVSAKGWQTKHTVPLEVSAEGVDADLPVGAANIRFTPAERGGRHFWRIAESLADYPYGCVEQTASRLIPLSLAYTHLKPLGLDPAALKTTAQLRDEIANARIRLVKMAGPNSAFGWWGDQSKENLLLTAYAYFADWQARQTLGIAAPPATWLNLLDVYKQKSGGEDVLTLATSLWLANEIGLPIKTQVRALVKRIVQHGKSQAAGEPGLLNEVLYNEMSARVKPTTPGRDEQLALTILDTLGDVGAYDPAARVVVDAFVLGNPDMRDTPLEQAAVFLNAARKGQAPNEMAINDLLSAVGVDTSTLERSLVLLLAQKAAGNELFAVGEDIEFTANPGLKLARSRFGQPVWELAGNKDALAEPRSLRISASKPAAGYLSYDLMESQVSKPLTNVQITRKLFKLELQKTEAADQNNQNGEQPADTGLVFAATEVKPGEKIDSSALYLDEVNLNGKGGTRFGAVDIPLPSGAEVETAPYAMKISGPGFVGENPDEDSDKQNSGQPPPLELDSGEYQVFPHHYTAPVDGLPENRSFLHLLRFSQRGEFELGRARYFEMYHPDRQALQAGDTFKLKVR